MRNTWRQSVPYSDNYGRDVIEDWANRFAANRPAPICLDIACGQGDDLMLVRKAAPQATLYGLDIDAGNISRCRALGITVQSTNLETESLPFPDETFDLIIANQIFEHLKHWVFSLFEITRVLKVGGFLVIGVPNLAAFHNRILLMCGRQPTCIHPSGMHVRGFTYQGLAEVVEFKGVYRIVDHQGRVFFPFPRRIALRLARLFPAGCSSLFVLCEKRGAASGYLDLEALQKASETAL